MEKGHICIRLPFNWQKVQATVNEWSQCAICCSSILGQLLNSGHPFRFIFKYSSKMAFSQVSFGCKLIIFSNETNSFYDLVDFAQISAPMNNLSLLGN